MLRRSWTGKNEIVSHVVIIVCSCFAPAFSYYQNRPIYLDKRSKKVLKEIVFARVTYADSTYLRATYTTGNG
jgi:hypothetical protein